MEVSLVAAFVSGLASFFAPCVIPLLPAYVGYISGVSLAELRKDAASRLRKTVWISSMAYVLGFSLVFVMMGTVAASFGGIFRSHSDLIQRLGGVFIMLLSLQFLGVVKQFRLIETGQIILPDWIGHWIYLRAFFIGLVFATTWTPCIGPVLGVILTLAAASLTAWQGAGLLFVYALGIMAPFLLLSGFLIRSPHLLSKVQKNSGRLSKGLGIFLFLLGFLLFNNTLKMFSGNLTYDALNQWLYRVIAW